MKSLRLYPLLKKASHFKSCPCFTDSADHHYNQYQAQQTRDAEQCTLHNYNIGWFQSCYLNPNFLIPKVCLASMPVSVTKTVINLFFYESLTAQAATAQCHFLKSCMLALQKAVTASWADKIVSCPTWGLWSSPKMKQHFQTVNDTIGN